MMKTKEVLIATLGFNPQVVTISLDLLQAKGHRIEQVISIYTDEAEVREALVALEVELQKGDGLSHRPAPVTGETGSIRDFRTITDVTGLMQTLYQEIERCKTNDWRIHLLIAGGRKVMSAYALVVAQLLFDAEDRAWHLFSNWRPGSDRQMHVGPNSESTLVPVPVLPVIPLPAAVDQASTNDPWQLIAQRQIAMQKERDRQIREFLRHLRPAKRAVAHLLAEGLDNQTIAARRNRSVDTVTKQVSDLYKEWRVAFDLPEDASVRDQIVAELSRYFAHH